MLHYGAEVRGLRRLLSISVYGYLYILVISVYRIRRLKRSKWGYRDEQPIFWFNFHLTLHYGHQNHIFIFCCSMNPPFPHIFRSQHNQNHGILIVPWFVNANEAAIFFQTYDSNPRALSSLWQDLQGKMYLKLSNELSFDFNIRDRPWMTYGLKCQGFCEDRSNALVIKCKNVHNCVTSFMDHPLSQ